MNLRVGHSYDVHQLKMTIFSHRWRIIPFEKGIVAHSDGDGPCNE